MSLCAHCDGCNFSSSLFALVSFVFCSCFMFCLFDRGAQFGQERFTSESKKYLTDMGYDDEEEQPESDEDFRNGKNSERCPTMASDDVCERRRHTVEVCDSTRDEEFKSCKPLPKSVSLDSFPTKSAMKTGSSRRRRLSLYWADQTSEHNLENFRYIKRRRSSLLSLSCILPNLVLLMRLDKTKQRR